MNTSVNKPMYLYQLPMFMVSVSTVLFIENGVVVIKPPRRGDRYSFPTGVVRAGLETIQFAAVRHVKEQTGLTLNKDLLIPVDFRSAPERSEEGNEIDIGFACVLDNVTADALFHRTEAKWAEVNFESKELSCSHMVINDQLYMDHETLLSRAIDVILMIKE